MKRNQFTFYRSYFDAIERLSVEEKGEILCALCAYALDEIMPENLSPIADTVFTLVKPTLDAGRKKAISGQKGGQTESLSSGSKNKARGKHAKSKSEDKIDSNNEDEDEDERLITHQTPFVPPTATEVAEYCQRNGYSVDANRFVDYYAANGWRTGNGDMKDWRPVVRNWHRKEKNNNGQTKFQQIWDNIGQSF